VGLNTVKNDKEINIDDIYYDSDNGLFVLSENRVFGRTSNGWEEVYNGNKDNHIYINSFHTIMLDKFPPNLSESGNLLETERVFSIGKDQPSYDNITILYIATFNRAPDKDGIDYWVNNSGLNNEEIAKSFFDQPETQEKYEKYDTHNFVKAVYNNLFNRDPDKTGWEYWENELNSSNIPKSSFILAVINGALGDDIQILANKQKVGLIFEEKGINDIQKAREIMKNISADPASVDEALAIINEW